MLKNYRRRLLFLICTVLSCHTARAVNISLVLSDTLLRIEKLEQKWKENGMKVLGFGSKLIGLFENEGIGVNGKLGQEKIVNWDKKNKKDKIASESMFGNENKFKQEIKDFASNYISN